MEYVPEGIKDFEPEKYVDKRIVTFLSLYGACHLAFRIGRPLACKMGRLLKFRKDLKKTFEGADWVIVTAGTGPIGEALCLEFAKAGFNIILISKSNIEAMKVTKAVKKDHGVQAIAIKYDFGSLATAQDAENLKKTIEEKTKDKNVGILVNNVTMSAALPSFNSLNFVQIMQMISANVLS